MPWHVARSGDCPESKPYAVIRDSNGAIEGCHESEEAARRQMAALYASEGASSSMDHKAFDLIEVKADNETGAFSAKFSVFNNVDLVGDRILPGAFEDTLKTWQTKGDPIPVVVSHQWDNLEAHIGYADPNDVVETDEGVIAKGYLDVEDSEMARKAHKLMKERRLKAFSFGYHVPKGGERRAKDGANEISKLELIEFGPTLKGANPGAEVLAVKTALEAQKTSTQAEEVKDAETDEEPDRGSTPGATPLRREVNQALLDLALDGVSEPERESNE